MNNGYICDDDKKNHRFLSKRKKDLDFYNIISNHIIQHFQEVFENKFENKIIKYAMLFAPKKYLY